VLEAGRSLIIGLNKWDGLSDEQRERVKRQLDVKLAFLDFAEKHPISALHGSGVGKLFDVVHKLYDSTMIDMSTPALSKLLQEATTTHQPPLVNGRRIKLKYAHQGGKNPPIIVIHGIQTDAVPGSYKSYLVNFFRQKLKLLGTPIRIEFRSPDNPFDSRKHEIRKKPMTFREEKKNKRLPQHLRNKTSK
jgi:GTPase